MWNKLFGSSKKDPEPAKPAKTPQAKAASPAGGAPPGNMSSTSKVIHKMNETIAGMEERERLLQNKIDAETAKAKEAMAKKNRNLAMLCMKRKKLYEDNLGKLVAQRANMETVKITMEDSAMNAEVLRAQREAASELTRINASMDADKVEDDMDKMREAMDEQQRIAEMLGQPIGADVVDEDDLMDELENMMKEDKKEAAKAQKATVKPAKVDETPLDLPKVPTGKLPETKVAAPVEEDDDEAELRRLEAELNM